MFEGRDIKTAKIVSSDDLRFLDQVDQDGYVCPECSIKIIPSSFRKENKVRPHFKIPAGTDHLAHCSEALRKVYIKVSRKQFIKSNSGEPYLLVGRLAEPSNHREVVEQPTTGGNTSTKIKTGHIPTKELADIKHENKPRKRSTVSLERIVDDYIQFPNNREVSPLELPGVEPGTYATLFKEVKDVANPETGKSMVYYCKMAFAQKAFIREDSIVVFLAVGRWVPSTSEVKGHWLNQLTTVLDTKGWNSRHTENILDEINLVNELARASYKTKSKKNGYAFIFGSIEDGAFRVSNHRHICFVYDSVV